MSDRIYVVTECGLCWHGLDQHCYLADRRFYDGTEVAEWCPLPEADDGEVAALKAEVERLKEGERAADTEIERLRAEVERLRAALPDPRKLRLLADWLDLQDEKSLDPDRGSEVQDSLRNWADAADQPERQP